MRLLIQHPPLRICTVLIAIAAGVSIRHIETLLLLLLFGQLWILLCKVPFQMFWQKLRLAIPFIVFSLLFFSFYEGGSMIVFLHFISISLDGVEKALMYAARLVFTLQMLSLLFFQVTYSTFFQSLIRLRIPSIFVELILFTLRFMDVIRMEALSMLQALKSRGMKHRNFFSLSYYVVLSRLLGSLLVRSLHRSERVYIGMMSRGYRGLLTFQDIPRLQNLDYIRMTLLLLPVCMSIYIDLTLGRSLL